jgi:transcriptional regulator with XRE-family HTH domain
MELNAEAVGRRLRELRGFDQSQESVADALGISRASLCLYENGQRIPGGEIASKLAAHYGTTTDYIFLGKK